MRDKVPYYVKEIRKGQLAAEQDNFENCPRLMIAGAGDSDTSEHVAVGLLAIWEEQQLKPRGFSAGPSYKNLQALRAASGSEAYSLDSWFHDEESLSYLLTHYTEGRRVAVISASQPYFDTMSPLMPAWSEDEPKETPKGSPAELARLTQTPVVMVVDADRFNFTKISFLKGLLDFRENECIAGFILAGLNKDNIEEVRRQIQAELELPVYGFVSATLQEMRFPSISELVPELYAEAVSHNLETLKQELRKSLDLSALLRLAGMAPALDSDLPQKLFNAQRFLGFENRRCRVAVAMDQAFSYYYRENLDLLNEMGVDLVYFSPLEDSRLPGGVDGIYLGGGRLLDYLAEASNNESMRRDIYNLAQDGAAVLAEGSAAVYLSRAYVTESGREWPLVGILPTVSCKNSAPGHLYYAKKTARRDDLLAEHNMQIPCLLGDYFLFSPEGASYRTHIRGVGNVMEGFSTPTVWAAQAQLNFYAQPMTAARFAASCLKRLSAREPFDGGSLKPF